MIEVRGDLKIYATKLRNDGNHAVVLGFKVPTQGHAEQLLELQDLLNEYCAVTINAGYDGDGKGEDISLSAMFKVYAYKPESNTDYFQLGFHVPMLQYRGALGRIISADVVAKNCRIQLDRADPQEPLPWAPKEKESEEDPDQLELGAEAGANGDSA